MRCRASRGAVYRRDRPCCEVMIKLTYLGVAGWRFRAGDSSLLIDPYFTRLSMLQVLFGHAVPDAQAIAKYTPAAQWILVSHAHYDHLMDVPEAARLAGAQVMASSQSVHLMDILGIDEPHRTCIYPGDMLQCGEFRVEVYESQHRKILGGIPYVGPLAEGLAPPLRARDYRMDRQLSFRITTRDLRVLVASGIEAEPQVKADVLIVGADAARRQLRTLLDATRPRLVLPNHWDDVFRPLSQPLRPMRVPPSSYIPTLRRISLEAFARRVCDLSPKTAVFIPRISWETDIETFTVCPDRGSEGGVTVV